MCWQKPNSTRAMITLRKIKQKCIAGVGRVGLYMSTARSGSEGSAAAISGAALYIANITAAQLF